MAGKDGVTKKALKLASGFDEVLDDVANLKEFAVEQDKKNHAQEYLVQRVDELARRIEQLETKIERNVETVQSMRADNQRAVSASDRHELDIRELRASIHEQTRRTRDDYDSQYQSLERRVDQLERLLERNTLIGSSSQNELSSLLRSVKRLVDNHNSGQSLLDAESEDNLDAFKKLPKP